jgi:hypothetical protein
MPRPAELLCVLLTIAGVLALVTVVGHGIWVFLAWLLRGRRSAGTAWAAAVSPKNCPRCGAPLLRDAIACTVCRWSSTTMQRQALDDLAAMSRQLDRFRQADALDTETYERLAGLITAERRQLGEPPRVAPAAAPPVLLSPPEALPVTAPALPPLARPAAADAAAQRVRAVADRMDAVQPAPATAEPPLAAPPGGPPRPHRPLSLGQPQEFLQPRPPRKPFTQVLAAFMEQKNIRWGELVGGLLIVGCSIALVISLWSQIAQIPVLKFFIFTLFTAAVFGAGLYTEHRWKLQTTSRGVLIISTLLVPLNFLAIAAFSEGSAANDPVTIGGEVVAIGLFLYLTHRAGGVLVPAWPGLLAVGVLGSSVAQLLVRRFAEPGMATPGLMALGALPLVFCCGSTGWMLARVRRVKEIGEREAAAVLTLLGIVTFAALMPFGLLLYKTGQVLTALRGLAPLVSLGGMPALATGLVLWRRLGDAKLAMLRTMGTSVGVIGTLVMLAGIVLAWPDPAWMLPVAALDFVALTAVALLFELPAAHLLAAPCLMLGYLVGFHAVREVGWHGVTPIAMARALLSAPSGTALVPIVTLLAGAAELFRRARRDSDAQFYTFITGGAGLLSLALVSAYGFARAGDPGGATWLFSLYAAGGFWLAWRMRRVEATWAASLLMLAALVQAIGYRFAEHWAVRHWHLAMMLHATAAAAAATLVRRVAPQWRELFADVLSRSALASSLVALPLMLDAASAQATGTFALNALWLAVAWLALAALHRLAGLFTAAQVALTLSVLLAVTVWLKEQAWYGASSPPWLDPRSLQAYGIALAVVSLAWDALRLGLQRFAVTPFMRSATGGVLDTGSALAPDARLDRGDAGRALPGWRGIVASLLYPPWPAFDRLVAVVVLIALIVPPAVRLFLRPGAPGGEIVEAGSAWGWLAVVLAGGAAVGLRGLDPRRLRPSTICCALLALGAMLSFVACRWDSAIHPKGVAWLGYHTLLAGVSAAGWLVLAGGWLSVRTGRSSPLRRFISSDRSTEPVALEAGPGEPGWQAPVSLWVSLVGTLAVFLALRGVLTDPARPWWSAGAIVAMSVLAAALARRSLRGEFLYLAGMLFNLATTIWWITEWWRSRPPAAFAASLIELVEVNVIALALPAIGWLMLELQVLWPARAGQRRPLPALHHLAAIGSLVGMVAMIAVRLAADAGGLPVHPTVAIGWLALGSAAALMIACLWDGAATYAVAGLYGSGLAAAGLTLDAFDLPYQTLSWIGVIVLAAYSVGTSWLWSQRERLIRLADRLHMPPRGGSALAGQGWLLVANQTLALTVVVLAYWIVLRFEDYPTRFLAAKAALAQALAVGLLAQGTRRTQLQRVALGLVVVGAAAWGWAWLEPGTTGNVLNRAVIVMTVLGAATALYGIGLTKLLRRETEWTRAARELVPPLVGLCAVSLVFVLGAEVVLQINTGAAPMAWSAIIAVAATLLGLAGAGVALALLPGRDPLELSEKGRMMYVYAAEALLALLFMHIRLTMPWLFRGFFQQFWPLIVMALAYLGVGLSELFRRQKRLVLAEPLERTGALLPILPVLGFWMATAGGVQLLDSRVHFSLTLVSVGLLYGVVSITRRSFGFGVLAAVAANGGLAYFLHHDQGFGVFDHAQIWLVPMALSVLAAAYLNRDRLNEGQMTAVRYITLMTVYVSSTADIFVTGVAQSPWLPLVLAGLSVGGVMAGIMLRVRAFLYLGSSFLVLSLVTMIRYAQVNFDWTWLWWAAGIVLGILILAVFGLFEKKRDEMLRVMDGLRQWQR